MNVESGMVYSTTGSVRVRLVLEPIFLEKVFLKNLFKISMRLFQ
ncbi:hypothetical protein BROSI_A0162 [Candidatus Brocadia sinica JPN1]|uniref:Uncharacterized protein n=1 Tax=Candidatus Brocadia sinica JPN1 TaxID=1197129 RepID=A0ABQ0JSG1_9BACT|nr:hypothetical protein BROSI_A0162 [Candidatus Brocadia sinica JPN1]